MCEGGGLGFNEGVRKDLGEEALGGKGLGVEQESIVDLKGKEVVELGSEGEGDMEVSGQFL